VSLYVPSRRKLLSATALGGVAAALAACSTGSASSSGGATAAAEGEQVWDGEVFDAEGETLRLAIWAAPFGDYVRQFALDQFEKDFNCKVSVDTSFPWFPKMAAAGAENPPFDLTNWNAWELAKTALAGDYFVSLDTLKANLTQADNMWPFAFENGYGVTYMYTGYGYAWRKDLVPEPTSFDSIFDASYDGQRATYTTDNGLQIDFFLALCDQYGSGYQDLDAGYQQMRDGAPWKVLDFTGNMQARLTSGEVGIAVLDDGESYQLMDQGVDLGFYAWTDYRPILTQTLAVSKYSTEVRQKLAYALTDRMCAPEFVEQFGAVQYQRPANKLATVPSVLADRGVVNTEDALQGFAQPDWKWFAGQEATVTREVDSIYAG
jgi:putative spermidine/putrescine transport system substrate-binding protein